MGDVPTWMAKGKTTLIQKDSEKRNAANNYHCNTFLLLMWKLLTSVLMNRVYAHLPEKNELTEKQKGSVISQWDSLITKRPMISCHMVE